MVSGIADRPVSETPIGILDFETTGLNPGSDRVVEVSVVRMEPGGASELALDTLVNPGRRMAATEIHGIIDDDVVDAPEFEDIAGDLVSALSDCAVAAYNVYFDMRFLDYELQRAGIRHSPPHICLMYLRPLLDLGAKCPLGEACKAHGIEYTPTHIAAQDVRASAQLMEMYSDAMRKWDIRTFRDLARLGSYKFFESFSRNPLRSQIAASHRACDRLKSRIGWTATASVSQVVAERPEGPKAANRALGVYWDALKAAVADLVITDEEIGQLKRSKQELGLREEQVRVLHARAFASVISQFIDDQWLDDRERRKLKRLHQCLSLLGWAPGE
jgi:DNA polymerase-3 subunit epsilon